MLILKLYPGQIIKIGDNVEIILLGNSNSKSRIGIKASATVKIKKEDGKPLRRFS